MKTTIAALAMLAVLPVASISAQVPADLSGSYRCIQNCGGAGLAYVTQNGWDLNLTNEAGGAARAWIDWPGHIWVQSWNEGAVYSPDGLTLQFDNGSVWQRIIPESSVKRRS